MNKTLQIIRPKRLEYVSSTNAIVAHFEDGTRFKIADVRGWGHLTSPNELNLPHEVAKFTQE